MKPLLFRIERNARLIAGGLALLTLVVLLLFKTGLIQFQPSFDTYGWYTVSTVSTVGPGLAVTHRADNEATCQAASRLSEVTCLQGRLLNTTFIAHSRLH